MKKVSVMNLPLGSYIDAPVFLDEEYILLSQDIPISEELLSRLKEWNYSHVFTDGTPSQTRTTRTDSIHTISPSILEQNIQEREMNDEAQEFFSTAFDWLAKIFDNFQKKDELRIDEITELVKEIISKIKENRRFIMSLPDIPAANYLVSHSVKTTILSVVIGEHFKLAPHKLIELGTAALLHQIGMFKIPEHIYMSDKPLGEKERQAIMAQPVLGFRILKSFDFPMPILVGVLESHERIDGTGYPRKLSGNKISLYGQIIAVATGYTAATSSRPYRGGLDGHSGIMDLLKNIGRAYDEKVIKALIFSLSLYPIGTYVELSNGTKGIVININPAAPKHPTVKLLVNEEGTAYMEQPILEMTPDGDIQINRSLSVAEVVTLKTNL
ncbi:MAG: HD domain-containing protein [Spirochaetales bacterium]|nr:HD domain-containing protein [Spirochaetales bacterium]